MIALPWELIRRLQSRQNRLRGASVGGTEKDVFYRAGQLNMKWSLVKFPLVRMRNPPPPQSSVNDLSGSGDSTYFVTQVLKA